MQTIDLKGYHLSLQQARLWALQGESQAYYAQCEVWLKGTLDMTALLYALQSLVRQHEILRTAFHCLPGVEIPVQVVTNYVEVCCPMIDLENLSASSQHLDEYLACLKHKDLNLEAHCLVFMQLLRFSSGIHLLLMYLPALCADGYTLTQMVGELSQIYTSFLRGIDQGDEPLQYADVAAWQDQLLVSEEGEVLRQYWRKIDLSQLATIRLPFEQKASAKINQVDVEQKKAFAPCVLEVPLEERISAQIKYLVQQYGVSMEAWFLACWKVVLWRLGGMQDLLIGAACDGRTYGELTQELAKTLGLYTRFVPVETDLEEDLPFDQILTSVNEALLEAIEQQAYFMWKEEAAENSATARGSTPLFFPLSFEYERWPASFVASELSLSLHQRFCCTEPFALKLSVLQVGEGLQLELHFDPQKFSSAQARRLATALRTLLQSAIAQPQAPLSMLSLLEPDEHVSLLTMGYALTKPLPPRGFCQLFEEQALRLPNYPAVISAQEQLTYQQLNERANQLARVLQRQGVGPNVLVGLCVARGTHMLVGLLGILKAGGAYVPLEPEIPLARLTYQLQESQATLLLTQQEVNTPLLEWGGKTLCLEDLEQEIFQVPAGDLPGESEAEDLAYVIYTSGSTGIPKGVMIQQSSVVNYTLALCELLEAEPGWQYAMVSTLAADLGNTVIFCALASGGCVQVLDYKTVTSTEEMARWIERHPIDVLKIVPSHLSALLTGERAKELVPRQALILGGEELPLSLLAWLRECRGSCQIYNHYGPTETTIGVLVNPLDMLGATEEKRNETGTPVPLGKPITNTEVYILDQWMHVVPEEVTGELYIGGIGLAMGYLGQAEQTAERFVPHPWSRQAGARLYRTGDLARYREQGKIEFVGRRDRQVKLRGYRIELAEIQTVLRQHPQIRSCVVMLREDMPGEPRLVSYVVAQQRTSLPPEQLREFLRQSLPEYMVPAVYVQIDALPLTANGKIDWQNLPVPEQRSHKQQAIAAGPRSPIEEILLETWRDLLGLPELDIHDHFFLVGGHSLLATRVMARVQAMLQVALPVQMLFEVPTVAELAQRVEQALLKGERIQVPPLVPVRRPEEIPLSFAQQRLWFLDQLEPDSTAYLIPSALRVQGDVNLQALQRSLGELVARHESLRTTFEMGGQGPVQVIRAVGSSALPLIDLTGLRWEHREQEVQSLARQEAEHPCKLTRGPLLRTCVVRLQALEHVLLLTLHHIITDGWSTGVLVRELTTLYQAKVSGQPSPLVPLPVQYADYALWQRQWLQGEILEAQLAYWRKQLAGVSPLALPTDHPRPAMQTHRGALQVLQLSEAVSEGLMALSRQQEVTLFMLLLAALQVVLLRYTGQSDISVGTPIANRRHRELEELIGLFVNTLVLRTDLSGNPSFVQVLQRVREVCLGAYAHQDIPFEKVVEELEPERDLRRSPLFQVLFVLQNAPREQRELTRVSVKPLAVESTISKFDLTLSVEETRQGLHCSLEYNTDLFKAETITRMLDHWQTLLQGVIQTPQARLFDLPLLTESEREQLLVKWNATQRDSPRDRCVHQLFEQQVEQTPDSVALVFEEEVLTYAVLNRRANQLAHYLQCLGIGPERLVGICMQRSIEMVLGVLSVLKAGGAYVPLDPSYPAERLAFMAADAHVWVLLTQERVHRQGSLSATDVIVLEEVWERLACQPDQNPISTVSAENLAYVIYTSGSTGVPRGVQVMHRNVANCFIGMDNTLGEQVPGIWLAVTSISFDISILELFWTLTRGFQVVVQPNDHDLSALQASQRKAVPAETLAAQIRKCGITHLQSTPSLASLLVLEPEALGPLDSLQKLLLGGEALSVSLVRQLGKVMVAEIYNMYGPTETTIWSTTHLVDKEAHTISIGCPMSNTQVYILDKYLQLLPVGVAGALFIGGHGIVRGYCNSPDLTAEKFLPDPFSGEAGACIYRTGDMARYRADGTIEYLGRMDQQVKVRGYRIELGEIEAVLGQQPAIQEAVVLAREEVPGNKRLVAYLVMQQGQMLTIGDLRSYLSDRLPEYMIPSAFLFVDVLPLTPNGKVDRRALPAPQPSQEGGQEGARTPIEELLMGIWSEVLGRRQVGIHENFFELGGHSLLATRLITRVSAVLQVEVPLRAVFEMPTVATFAQRVQEALGKDEGMSVPPLLAMERPEEIPLSFAQQRLWFLDQLEPDSTAYLIPSALRVQGEVNLQALQRSLGELVARHESLRTTFEMGGQGPVQVIHAAGSSALPLIDLTGLRREHREQEVQSLACQEAERPCKLTRGPLLRTCVVRLQALEHVLLLTLHHIITDGWSTGVLVRELTTLYQAFVTGQPSPLVPLPVQYADYALWQRQWLQGEILEAQLAYWRKQLAGVSPLALPTDHPRPAMQTHRGAVQVLQVSEAVSEGLMALSRQQEVTLFMLLLAALQVVLLRYTGQSDISVGTPIANRRHRELEELIGLFVNTLVLRTDLSGNPSFVQVLQRVREVCLGAYAHQDIPFEKVVEELEPERDLSRSPLFQVLFVLQNGAGEQEALSEVSIKPLAVESTISKFDLTLSVEETKQGLHCSLEYNTDLFEAETIIRMLDHWQTLLQGVVQTPQAHISDIPVLAEAERHQLLVEWNATHVDFPQEVCVHQLFEQQVEQTPEAVALVFEDETLTYAELNRRANQLAYYLQGLDIGPDGLVGICMHRSIEMVIGLLGVLKAGGAYVPLDPTYPDERLAFMVADAHISVLLVEQQLQKEIPLSQARVIVLEQVWERLVCEPNENLMSRVSPENLAYIIYTSGSTGVPKGAMNTHRGICNRLFWMQLTYQLMPQDRVLQKTSFSFDVSVWEFFWPLLTGASLTVARPGSHQDPAYLKGLIAQQQVTILHFVPSMLEAFLRQSEGRDSGSLRLVICSGEMLSAQLQAYFFARFSEGVHLHNLYGPTEAAIDVTFWGCQHTSEGRSVPIGRPIANTQIYLLDKNLQPVPIGVAGELYIGGVGLARGYFKRPELTAEKFMVDPFSQQGGARIYCTGDVARYRADGTIEYLGRVDDQVKLRGYRIELGEIEAILGQQPMIQEAVVLAREDVPGNKCLVAYLVMQQGQMLTIGDLRSYLSDRLPEYMIPSAFLFVDVLPLTPNGKVDRRALPAPQPSQEGGQEGARTPIEELLMGIWGEVLGRRQVGIHENFFELGGHSLLATRLIARVKAMLGVELPLRAVFDTPTVMELAQRVEQALRKGEELAIPPLVAVERPEKIPLSFAQQRLWFLDQLEPGSAGYLRLSAYRLQGVLQVQYLEQSLDELIRRHESLRTTFALQEEQPVQVIHPMGCSALLIIDLQGLRQEQREEVMQWLAGQERERPCDLEKGPLQRTALLRLETQEHVLLLTLHHIITDGWSTGVLVHELTTLYQAFVAEQSSPLVPLPVQYADYALWQRQWLQGKMLEEQLAYWRKQLAGVSPLALPTDYPRPAVQTHQGTIQSRQLPQAVSEGLLALSRQQDVTLFMLLLAAFQVLLARYTGQSDLSVGTPIANRRHVELEGMIGFFVNTLVLRTDLSGNPTLQQVLKRVREVCLGAYAHQDIPFEKVVEELEPERDLSRSPLFQVMFVLQNVAGEQEQLSGVSVKSLAVESTTSKFDLTLLVAQTGHQLHCALEYNTNLFETETIRRMLDHWQTLLEGIVHHPQAHVSDLPLLTESERVQLLVQWNATQSDSPQDVCVHQLFEQQVERTPDAVAVVFEQEYLTYCELNRRANQLAHSFQEMGIGPERLVGICMERSIEMVIGLLSVLKAGGAYVPLDPTYPTERLAFMVTDAQVRILLTQERVHRQISLSAFDVIVLEEVWERLASQPNQNPISTVSVENLAYIIYTSGSTGIPKGVQVTHRGLGNLGQAQAHTFAIGPESRVLQFASLNFDASIWEILMALLVGASLYLERTEQMLPGPDLLQVLQEQAISVMTLPPSALAVLPTGDLPTVETLIVAGEACPVDLMAHWALGRHFFNAYGPTEMTVCASMAQCSANQANQHSLSLGQPLANTQLYLLNQHLQLVPSGVPGEICLGGVGLARGYLNLSEMTAKCFIPHPFSTEPGARLYRTGDLARYLPDGTLEFLGRMDQQVKLRGYRIELGEIEAVLRQHPAVEQCIVVKREEPSDNEWLVAYVVTRSQDLLHEKSFRASPFYQMIFPDGDPRIKREDRHYARASRGALHSFLQERLPNYMVPAKLMFLDALPLTPNGKVDRRALPSPNWERSQEDKTFLAPSTVLEKKLAAIWTEVLHIEQVDVHDNFFDLGGYSLLLIQLQSKLQACLGYEVPIVDLFAYPTIYAFSNYLSKRREDQPMLQLISERVRRRKQALDQRKQVARRGV